MTYAPATLTALAAYWMAQGGVNLGIVGDTAHAARGVSYHLGAGQLLPDAYSVQTTRDRAGLTNAASAIDLGKLGGSLPQLRAFSTWLVAQARANAPGTSDLREIIWSPDGVKVLRWDRERGYASEPRTGEADDSHLTHTHISFYRDSEKRDHTTAFRPYFEEEADMQAAITDEIPGRMDVPLGAPLLELDGKTVLRKMTTALPDRWSPYGVRGLRAMFATVGVRRVVLVKPTAVRPIPATDCAPLVVSAVESLQVQLGAANARLSAIKQAGGF